jgi:hypothetical protein
MSDDDDDEALGPVERKPKISAEQKAAYLEELVNLKTNDGQIAYEERRNEIARLTGWTRGALDTDVDARLKTEDSQAL